MNNPNIPSSNDGPQPIGEVMREVLDTEGQQIAIDPVAEHARQLATAERLADTLREARSALISDRQAGKPVDEAEMEILGEELQQAVMRREELKQQTKPNPLDH